MDTLEKDFEEVFEEIKDGYIFQDPDAHLVQPSVDRAQSIVDSIENEYKNLPDIKVEREKERANLQEKLKKLTIKLKKVKNVKNHRRTDINAQKASERKKIKMQIEEVKNRLYQLERENEGSEITPTKLMDEMLLK